uniref:DUF448 domain-containing protein n=1 Tax=Echinostoma caproni TaxID=27848 RepID=A0A183BAD4_9TREM
LGVLQRRNGKTYVRLINQSEVDTVIRAIEAEVETQKK